MTDLRKKLTVNEYWFHRFDFLSTLLEDQKDSFSKTMYNRLKRVVTANRQALEIEVKKIRKEILDVNERRTRSSKKKSR